ncbi:MAG TPA: hypothetical protein VL523_13690 [Terriglobia bacterium]|nr:hypothetical protein [Terriglobia bacterium]
MTIEQLTAGVLGLCIGGSKKLESDRYELGEGLLDEVDRDAALGELFMLRLVVATYANQRFFTATAQQEVRRVFNRCLHAMLMDSGDEKVKSQPDTVIDEMHRRCQLYLEAVQTPHHLGPAWSVGNVFAKLCGHERDPKVVGAGFVAFAGGLLGVTEFLKECKLMDGGEVITLAEA